ncbi:6-hydroxypseudooxynicotine dehydrogenase complex subunit alpha [Methylobacterium crusticola]|uniref:6-hydroxypseudooxynicotine dehydrogenase complex subunit alpha n=1 Tax=Methylobacterium crusticola TaxID=1697972 RepID=A0ABQ4QRQ7_9HYPH|nr:xanthine dehydrogenase family protein subunit M [Methylobacterium crusticola]GJD47302.1 6-hydroxypseudooxynicotine dehydrogenase complex subunit alpha [Methylobacterium crusticola]
MKAPEVAYACPSTLDEALTLLSRHGDEARPLAGGQSLVTALNMRLAAPALLVDLNRIPDLAGITRRDGVVRVGAMTRHRDLGASDLVRDHLPLVAAAVPHIAHPAIRNRGTLGGSVALGDPAAELPACCLALGATMVLRGQGGERRVPADAFFLGLYATAIAPAEILVAIEFPLPEPGAVWGFQELARRHGDYALAGLAATARRRERGLDAVRLVFFGVGDRPVLARGASAALAGAGIRAAQAALDADIDPPDDVAVKGRTRRHLARVLLGRVAGGMLEGAP